MTPVITRNAADDSITITMDQAQALAVAASLHDMNLEAGRPVLDAIVGSPRWREDGGPGIVTRDAYDAFRSSQGLLPV